MGIFKKLFGSRKPKKQPGVSEEGTPESCPFCWGYEKYDEADLDRSYNKQIDVKNHRDKHVKVGKFMVEHVEGYKKQKRIIERCSKCGGKRIRYKEN